MKLPISVIILTYNEELNIENCLKNIVDWADEILIVDSYSADGTARIAKSYNVKFIQHPFENQAQQFNWALDNLEIKNDWILRLDADEYLTEELKEEIRVNPLLNNQNPRQSASMINGFYINRRVYFMGCWMKHGGYYPTWLLRLFKKGKARSEQRRMDEHIILLEGKAEKLKNDFVDDNKKDLTWWIEKHNNYASREASVILNPKPYTLNPILGGQAGRKRWLKENFYYKMPMFFRACAYFCHRYFFRLGFLDGKEGLMFHFFQGLWYRFLIDAKIYEAKKKLLK